MCSCISDNIKFPVVDIFAGPGGLGEGFASVHGVEDESPFDIHLSVENNKDAVNTLIVRHVYRQLKQKKNLSPYYSWLRSTATMETLREKFPNEYNAAQRSVLQVTLGGTRKDEQPSRDLLQERLQELASSPRNWVLIGGPPCQAYSIIGRVKNNSLKMYDPLQDPRFTLYGEYIRILKKYQPAVFLMENVVGILSAQYKGKSVISAIFKELKKTGYTLYSLAVEKTAQGLVPADYVIKAEEYGVPQKRHRVIILGIREDITTVPQILQRSSSKETVSTALYALPTLSSTFSYRKDREVNNTPDGVSEYLKKAILQDWFRDEKLDRDVKAKMEEILQQLPQDQKLRKRSKTPKFLKWLKGSSKRQLRALNHESRSHMPSDLYRYLFVSCFGQVKGRSPKLSDFPDGLLPKHASAQTSNFTDRFRVQLADQPATTITSHISKDGHYYIHPDPAQCRSLTVREAARLQTFPDNYYFSGFPLFQIL